jgi:transglutaminase-like putative cysteine protease
MNRRHFLNLSLASGAAFALPRAAFAATPAGDWRTFDLTYDVQLNETGEAANLWLPLPQALGDFQLVEAPVFSSNADASEIYRDPRDGTTLLHARWNKAGGVRTASVTTRVSTRNRQVDPVANNAPIPADVARFIQPSASLPTDGIVAQRAADITQGAHTQLEKAQAVYQWIVENTFRDPKVRGCGRGDIRFMLESGDLGGKCADLSSLFVGLARASGVPARETYGIRVADSTQFKSLGKSGDVSKAQHCRAEFYLAGTGWVPVDPADVRKAILEEKLTLDDPKIAALRARAFGAWEMNWVGLNRARDFVPQPPTREALTFFMYPHAETHDSSSDDLDPSGFKYTITSREV